MRCLRVRRTKTWDRIKMCRLKTTATSTGSRLIYFFVFFLFFIYVFFFFFSFSNFHLLVIHFFFLCFWVSLPLVFHLRRLASSVYRTRNLSK